jgi:hypothetical protein
MRVPLRDAACVPPVGLDRHGRERRLDVPCFQQHRIEPRLAQPVVEPLRQGAGLQANPGDRQPELAQEADQRFRLACHLGLAHDLAGCVQHAQAAQLQRHIDPDMVLHRRFS